MYFGWQQFCKHCVGRWTLHYIVSHSILYESMTLSVVRDPCLLQRLADLRYSVERSEAQERHGWH